MSKETVLITGPSSGIGQELARLFAADGSDLILVARSEGKLKELASELKGKYGTDCRVLPKDLTDPASPQAIHDELTQDGVQVDVVVNNAGFGSAGKMIDLEPQRQLDMLQVNVVALTHLTRLFAPGMAGRRRGGILNVGSTAAFQPGPNLAVYYATKAYVLSFSEAVAEELGNQGVSVTCLCPGPTITGFGEDSGMSSSLVFRMNAMELGPVAQAGYDGFRSRKAIVVPGLTNRLGTWSLRLTPRFLVRKILHRLNSN